MADYVVLCAPRTPETVGMIGVEEFVAMKEEARFINVARGDLVDEGALISRHWSRGVLVGRIWMCSRRSRCRMRVRCGTWRTC